MHAQPEARLQELWRIEMAKIGLRDLVSVVSVSGRHCGYTHQCKRDHHRNPTCSQTHTTQMRVLRQRPVLGEPARPGEVSTPEHWRVHGEERSNWAVLQNNMSCRK